MVAADSPSFIGDVLDMILPELWLTKWHAATGVLLTDDNAIRVVCGATSPKFIGDVLHIRVVWGYLPSLIGNVLRMIPPKLWLIKSHAALVWYGP